MEQKTTLKTCSQRIPRKTDFPARARLALRCGNTCATNELAWARGNLRTGRLYIEISLLRNLYG